MTPSCHSCDQSFADYGELAKHIAASKKGHRKGKVWAANYLLRTRALDTKKFEGRRPLTEADKANKASTKLELSGATKDVLAVCPRCHKGHRESLPVEYAESNQAWRQKNCLVLLCRSCKRFTEE